MGRAAQTMHGIARLGRVMRHMRNTSRSERAVRTMQRLFRQKKLEREGRARMAQIISIQRHIRRWNQAKRNREMGRSVCAIINFLQGCSRLTPMEMAVKRFSTRVKVMQRFMRGALAKKRGKLLLLALQWRKLEIARIVSDWGTVAQGKGGAQKIATKGQYAHAPSPPSPSLLTSRAEHARSPTFCLPCMAGMPACRRRCSSRI